MVILKPAEDNLQELLGRVLDKGVVIDTSIRFRLSSVDFLGIKAHVVLASFKTAEKAGLDFPEGTDLNTPAWQGLTKKQLCPVCGMGSRRKELEEEGCPWCGWNHRPKER